MPNAIKISAVLLSAILLVGLLGCSDKAADKADASNSPAKAAERKASAKKKDTSATNRVATAETIPGATSNELVHIKACLDALDDGKNAFAMRHARELMCSTNVEVRLQAVDAFGWVGRFAVKELAEMMTDPDQEVCSEAQRQWEMAFDEISSETVKMEEIERAAFALKDQTSLDAVMMKICNLEDYNAIRTLCRIITSTNASPVAAEVARSEYLSLAGEPFLDAKRAEQVATELKKSAEGLLPVPPQGQSSAKTKVGSRAQRDQGKEKKK